MKRQDYVFGSTTSNIEEQTPEALNNGWVELSILYSRVLNGVCAALSQSTNIVSQEVANAIVGMGVALNPASDNQLLQVLQKLAIKATDFESPITASNKGATMKEIEEVVTSSFTFKGYVSTTQPTGNLVVDNLWINLSTMPSTFPVSASLIKKWNGSTWVNYGSAYTPMNFDAFRNNNDDEGYYWFGGQWKVLSTDLSTDYFRLNQTSGKWEIKSSVNLPGTPTCDTPSASNIRAIVNVDFLNNNTISSRNFTNCLTEISQDIKLELNNGTLTLKAGSKVYVPNGFEQDGITPKFDVVTIASDITKNDWGSGSDILFLTVQNGSYIYGSKVSDSGSGTSTESTNGIYYRTNANVIYPNNNTSNTKQSFPIAIVTKTNGVPTSIDQVFNGFGYIGSTAFALPGVRALAPDGRNADGTLKNRAITISAVSTTTDVSGVTGSLWYTIDNNNITRVNLGVFTFNEDLNYFVNSNGQKFGFVIIDENSYRTSGKVTSFNPKQAFRAVDYSEYAQTKKSLDNKVSELDNQVSQKVNKSGDTMTGNLAMNDGDVIFKDTQTAIAPSTDTWHKGMVSFLDKNNVRVGYIQPFFKPDGTMELRLASYDPVNGNKFLNLGSNGNLVWNGNPVITIVAKQDPTSENSYTWYRKYADGWVEQGGRFNRAGATTVNLPIEMADADAYNLQLTSVDRYQFAASGSRTTNSFNVTTGDDSTSNNDAVVNWRVCGYAA